MIKSKIGKNSTSTIDNYVNMLSIRRFKPFAIPLNAHNSLRKTLKIESHMTSLKIKSKAFRKQSLGDLHLRLNLLHPCFNITPPPFLFKSNVILLIFSKQFSK